MPHGQAFLVAKISSVEPAPEDTSRYIIRFTEAADISIPDAWQGWRNPVKYCDLSDLGIDAVATAFEQIPDAPNMHAASHPTVAPRQTMTSTNGLSIADAKAALAEFYKVPHESIEITIRG